MGVIIVGFLVVVLVLVVRFEMRGFNQVLMSFVGFSVSVFRVGVLGRGLGLQVRSD